MKKNLRKVLVGLGVFCLVVAVIALVSPRDLGTMKEAADNDPVAKLNLAPESMSSMDRECLFAYITEEDVDINVIQLVDVEPEEEITEATEVTFAADVTAGQNVYLLHYTGSEWETIYPDSVDDGYITATFTSLSPVAVVDGTAASGDATTPQEITPEQTPAESVDETADDTSSEAAQDSSDEGAAETQAQMPQDAATQSTAAADAASEAAADAAADTAVEAVYSDTDESSLADGDDSGKDEAKSDGGDDSSDDAASSRDNGSSDSASSATDNASGGGAEAEDAGRNTDTAEDDDAIKITSIKAHGMNISDESATPDIYVYAGDEMLTEGEDYTLSFYDYDLTPTTSDITEPGTYYVKATGTGEYTGAVADSFDVTRLKSADFDLNPADAALVNAADGTDASAVTDPVVDEAAAQTVNAAALTVMLSGQIDDIYGNAVSGVVVSADSGAASSTTGSSGVFSIEGLATGTHSVSFIRNSVTIATVSVVAESTTNVNVTETYLDAGFSLSYAASLVTSGNDEVILVSFTGTIDESAVSTVTEAEVSASTAAADSSDSEDDTEEEEEEEEETSSNSNKSDKTSATATATSTKNTTQAAPKTGDRASFVFPILVAIIGINLVVFGIIFKNRREEDE